MSTDVHIVDIVSSFIIIVMRTPAYSFPFFISMGNAISGGPFHLQDMQLSGTLQHHHPHLLLFLLTFLTGNREASSLSFSPDSFVHLLGDILAYSTRAFRCVAEQLLRKVHVFNHKDANEFLWRNKVVRNCSLAHDNVTQDLRNRT